MSEGIAVKVPFIEAMEDSLRTIIENSDTTVSERLQAITAGTKLVQIKHNIADKGEPESKKKSFFDKDQ